MMISIKNLKKSFANQEIFGDFNMNIELGKITAIFGPNGSGKSTLLNILSGLIASDGGEFQSEWFDNFQFSYIFQNYRESLLPWRTNFENIALPLQIQGKNKQEIIQKIKELQELFEVNFDLSGYPYELSGGQQQILVFMRAVITNPSVLFIDEPFSALDYENNLSLRKLLQKYYLAFKPTILLITHNIEEAVHLAEKIAVFSQRPTKVIKTIGNSELYPRTIQFLKTSQFQKIKEEVLAGFQQTIAL